MKEPEFNLKLSQLDKLLLNVEPFFRILPLRVTMSFKTLSPDKLRLLEDYADVVEGKVERWLLIPSTMPLAVLGYTVCRAFGIMPSGPLLSGFKLAPERRAELAPAIGDVLPFLGAVFEFIPDIVTEEQLFDSALKAKNMVPPPPYDYEWIVYGAYQEEVRRLLLENTKEFLYNGVKADYRTLEVNDDTLEALSEYIDLPVLADNLLPFLPVPYVLQKEGGKLYSGDEVLKTLSKDSLSVTGHGAKPFAREILFFSSPDEDGFVFTVQRPKDVSCLFREGYIELDQYIDAAKYVARTGKPDCICKKGFDLFGMNEENYYDFMLKIHSPDSVAVRQIASDLGWREPYMDLKKILR